MNFSPTKSSQTPSTQINVFVLLQNIKAKIQNKPKKTNKLHKTNKKGQKPRVCFVLVSYFQTSGSPWSMVCIPRRPSLNWRKLIFFPPLLPVTKAFLVRCGTLCLFPFSKLGFCMVWASACHSCAIIVSEFICVSVVFCLESRFFGVAHSLWLIQSFCPFK